MPLSDQTIRTSSADIDTDIELARSEYLAAFAIYQRNQSEENRLAQKRAYDRLEDLYRTYAEGRMTMYEFVCSRQVR